MPGRKWVGHMRAWNGESHPVGKFRKKHFVQCLSEPPHIVVLIAEQRQLGPHDCFYVLAEVEEDHQDLVATCIRTVQVTRKALRTGRSVILSFSFGLQLGLHIGLDDPNHNSPGGRRSHPALVCLWV